MANEPSGLTGQTNAFLKGRRVYWTEKRNFGIPGFGGRTQTRQGTITGTYLDDDGCERLILVADDASDDHHVIVAFAVDSRELTLVGEGNLKRF